MPTPRSPLFEKTDNALLRASRYDPEAFGVFYDRHVNDVLAYFFRRTGCSHNAADLTAETFAEALNTSHRYREWKGAPRAWLFGIAHHQLTHFLRRQEVKDRSLRRLGIRRVAADDDSLERIETLVDAADHYDALSYGLRRLSPLLREAVTLRVANDLSFEEVAHRLGCSPGTARVRVSRGLTQLAQVMHA